MTDEEDQELYSEILIVDDDAFSAFSLESILKENFGIESTKVFSGIDAIKIIEEREKRIE